MLPQHDFDPSVLIYGWCSFGRLLVPSQLMLVFVFESRNKPQRNKAFRSMGRASRETVLKSAANLSFISSYLTEPGRAAPAFPDVPGGGLCHCRLLSNSCRNSAAVPTIHQCLTDPESAKLGRTMRALLIVPLRGRTKRQSSGETALIVIPMNPLEPTKQV